MRQKLVSLILALAMMVTFTGIGSAEALSDIVKRGELRVAVQSGAAPYAFVDKLVEQSFAVSENQPR